MKKSLTSHNDWRYLLRDFLRTPQGRPFASGSKEALNVTLAPVAALSLWIDEFAPALKEKAKLDIVIAGAAHGMDTLDEGRWYQLLPTFLGRPDMDVSVDLVGKGLDSKVAEVFSGNAFPLAPKKSELATKVTHIAAPARFSATLGEYMNLRADRPAPDLVFVFHPGFVMNSNSWIVDGDLRSALSKGAYIGFASYGEEEHMEEVWILASHGYKADAKVVQNRFAANLHNQVLPSAFAHTMWRLDDVLPEEDAPISEENLSKIKLFDGWMYEAGQKGVTLPFLKAFGGMTKTKHGDFIILPNMKLIDKASGAVCEPSNAEKFNALGLTIESDQLETYPEDSPFDFDRAYWAINVAAWVEENLSGMAEEGNNTALPGLGMQSASQDGAALFVKTEKKVWSQ